MKTIAAFSIFLACSIASADANSECPAVVLSAASAAKVLRIPLKADEKSFSYLALTGRPNEVALSTSAGRIVFIDLKKVKITQSIEADRAGTLEFSPTNDWFTSSSGMYGASYLINRKSGEIMSLAHPSGMGPNLTPSGIALHPTQSKALSFHGTGKYPVIEVDLDARQMKPLVTTETPVGLSAANADYMNDGQEVIVTMNSGSINIPSTGLILNSDGIPSHIFQLPEMAAINGAPSVRVAPEGRVFATVTIAGPAYHEEGERTAWVHVFAPDEEIPNEPQLIESSLRFLVKGPQSGLFLDRPYIPPTAFTHDGKLLVGNYFGTVDLYNMSRPVEMDDYQTGEHLTSFEQGHNQQPITALAASKRFFASGAQDGTVAIWSTDGSAKHMKITDFPECISTLTFVVVDGKEKLLVESKADDKKIGDPEAIHYSIIELPKN